MAGRSMVVSGIKQTRDDFEKLAEEVASKSRTITRHFGALVQADVRARARNLFDVSSYDRTIELRMTGKRYNPAAIVTSTAPQAHRLEFGFVGVDALGRSYHQPPRPHFRPALAKYAGQYRQSIEALFQ